LTGAPGIDRLLIDDPKSGIKQQDLHEVRTPDFRYSHENANNLFLIDHHSKNCNPIRRFSLI